MGANGSHGQAGGAYSAGGYQSNVAYQSGPVVPYSSQQASVQYSQGGGYGPGGPLGSSDPNMVWDDARGGYWVKETVVDQTSQDYDTGGAYTVYGGSQPGKIIRKTKCCDPPPPDQNIIVHNHKKIIHYDSDSDEDITIVTPPPVVVMPPQQPATNVFIIPQCCPEKPKPAPCGPATFFPEVREKRYQMETQTKSGPCVSSPCAGVTIYSCGPCGGKAPPSCGRCLTYHH